MKKMKKLSWNRLAKLAQYLYVAFASASASFAASTDHSVWAGDVNKGLEMLDKAITLSVVIGCVIVAIGFVLAGVKYMKTDDMQGSKDVLVKCVVAGAVIAIAPALVKFIIGSFGVKDYSQMLGD